MTYIGIDVSKDSFVAAYPLENGYRTQTFINSPMEIRKFIRTLSKEEHHCVMEATGNYSYLLLYLLSKAEITTSMENPLKIKSFARAMLSTTKTDELDAQMIALYGKRMEPAPFKMPTEAIMELKQKRAVIAQFKKQLRMNQNFKKSIEVLPKVDHATIKSIDRVILSLSKQIRQLEDDLSRITKSVYEKQMKALTSIKGVGVAIASAIIISTGGFSQFDNAKQVSRYLGLCPTYQQSGTSVHIKGHINRNGDPSLRSQLYVAAWSASQHNAACHDLYLRMKDKGKPGNVIMIAVANKMIRQMFAVVKHDCLYQDGFVSQRKNA